MFRIIAQIFPENGVSIFKLQNIKTNEHFLKTANEILQNKYFLSMLSQKDILKIQWVHNNRCYK